MMQKPTLKEGEFNCRRNPFTREVGMQIFERFNSLVKSSDVANSLTRRTTESFADNSYSGNLAMRALMRKGLNDHSTKDQAQTAVDDIVQFYQKGFQQGGSSQGARSGNSNQGKRARDN